MDIDKSLIGKRFKEFLAFSKIKQKDLALAWEIPSSRITNIINGDVYIQNYANEIFEIGCNLNWLLTGNGTMFAFNEAGEYLRELSERQNEIAALNLAYAEKTKKIDINPESGKRTEHAQILDYEPDPELMSPSDYENYKKSKIVEILGNSYLGKAAADPSVIIEELEKQKKRKK